MSAEEFMTRLGAWEGYRVGSIRRVAGAGGARAQVWIELEGCPEREKRCAGCGRVVDAIHDREERRVRDLPLFEAETWLVIPRYRLACPSCGPKLEALPWLDRYARVTARLAESVARLCQVLPIKHVAAFFGLSWDTVKAIDKSALERQLGPIQLDGVELLLIDEFAIQRGHRYATVIVDAPTKRVLWVGRGRGRADIRPFFERLGPAGCRRIKAIGMDMNGAYELEVRAHCPQAEIVYDLFHVVAKYGREVIDRVRVDEANRLRHDKPARRIVKSARWLLLRNRENVTAPDDRGRLDELLRANRALMTVYVLRDDLKCVIHGDGFTLRSR